MIAWTVNILPSSSLLAVIERFKFPLGNSILSVVVSDIKIFPELAQLSCYITVSGVIVLQTEEENGRQLNIIEA